jgi:exodeoxyribonuclease VII small subunit|tara:strand:+ start:239 stop:496 length:258 start_codon:yes stop_codon:yes gene_type:complete
MAAKAKRQADPNLQELSYSQAQEQLEQALAQLQSESLPLEELPQLYAQAVALEKHCRQKLEQVSQDIQKLDPDAISLSPWQEEEG